MSLLQPANRTGRLYVGLYGPEGAGKSFTAVSIALAARHALGLEGPIVAFDTEHAFGFHANRVREATGKDLLVCDTRDVKELIAGLGEAKKAKASVCIVDSITHFLRELREEYRKKRGKEQLDVGDYVAADKPFKDLLDKMLRSTSNLIICGRLGQVYGLRKNTKGSWVSGPIGTKMNAGETGYEVDLLLELSRTEQKTGGWVRSAVVKKDRSNTLEGQSFQVPWKPSEVMGAYFDFLKGGSSDGEA